MTDQERAILHYHKTLMEVSSWLNKFSFFNNEENVILPIHKLVKRTMNDEWPVYSEVSGREKNLEKNR